MFSPTDLKEFSSETNNYYFYVYLARLDIFFTVLHNNSKLVITLIRSYWITTWHVLIVIDPFNPFLAEIIKYFCWEWTVFCSQVSHQLISLLANQKRIASNTFVLILDTVQVSWEYLEPRMIGMIDCHEWQE